MREHREHLDLLRRLAIAVAQLLEHLLDLLLVLYLGELAVGLQAQTLRSDVFGRDVRIHRQVDADLLLFLLPAVDGLAVSHRAKRLHCFADQADIKVEAHARDVAGLLGTQDVARTAHLQVLHGHRHARAQVVVLGDGCQPVVGGLGQHLALGVEEVGITALAGTPHAAAQLVQLG